MDHKMQQLLHFGLKCERFLTVVGGVGSLISGIGHERAPPQKAR